MLFAEVSKSMGELAAAINKKNQELDLLKNEYEKKLRLVEAYLLHLPAAEPPVLDARDFVSNLENLDRQVTCPNCSNTILERAENMGFVLLPKNRLRPRDEAATCIEKPLSNPEPGFQVPPLPGPSSRIPQHNIHSKLKRTCSYCNKPGHSRARCFTRLSREPSSG